MRYETQPMGTTKLKRLIHSQIWLSEINLHKVNSVIKHKEQQGFSEMKNKHNHYHKIRINIYLYCESDFNLLCTTFISQHNKFELKRNF